MTSVSRPDQSRRPRHPRLSAALVCVVAAVAVVGSTAWRVVRASSGDTVRHADAIVVFGAAEYDGRPSPVYRARLDHAYDLFCQGLAPVSTYSV